MNFSFLIRSSLIPSLLLGIIILQPMGTLAGDVVTNSLDKKLQPYANNYNTKLPAMVAPGIRQDPVTVYNGVIAFNYVFISKTAGELASLNLETSQRSQLFPAICNASDTGRMLREGISFRYVYFGRDGKVAAQIIVMPSDCRM